MKTQILTELEQIRDAHGGILRAGDVVKFAANKKTALHSQFDWDDTNAAERWRLHQARNIIRVAVVVLPQTGKPIKAYVSMKGDRKGEGGGYRTLVDVMRLKRTREKFLEEALEELAVFQHKYEALTELAPVFAAARGIRSKRLIATAE